MNEYFVFGTNPKSVVSAGSTGAIANGSMPQATHSGALIPATAVASTEIFRSVTIDKKLQNVNGIWPVTVTRTCLAVEPPADPPAFASDAIASAAVPKNAGSEAV